MSRRDIFLVAFLIFNSIISALSLLFGDRMQALLVAGGVSKSIFQVYMVFLVFVVLGSLGLVSWFVFKRAKEVVTPPVVEKKPVAVDEHKRLDIIDEVAKAKEKFEREMALERERELMRKVTPQPRSAPVVQVRPLPPVDKNVYYDNGYEDENNVFHEYESRGD